MKVVLDAEKPEKIEVWGALPGQGRRGCTEYVK